MVNLQKSRSRAHASLAACPAIAVAVASLAACQTVAGIEDKQLDPAFNVVPDAGRDAPDGGVDTLDAAKDVASESLDSSAEGGEAAGGAGPPGRPAGDASPSEAGKPITFAVRRFFIGMVDPATEDNDPNAWRSFGFDYDGECTTREQSELDESATCLRPMGANEMALEDGNECRDNLGGHLLSESLQVMDSSFEKKMHSGTWNATEPTILLHIEDLDEGPDDPYAPARLYVTAPRTGIEMVWDGDDLLQVDMDSLVDGVMPVSKYELPNAYVRNHVWVSGDFKGLPMTVPMMILNRIAPVPTETATLMVELDEVHSEARGGMFAAVLDTVTLEPFLQIGMLEATGCNQVLTQMAMGMFLPNRDLAKGAEFIGQGEECGLMSIGVGLELRRVRTPETAVEVTPVPSTCADGG